MVKTCARIGLFIILMGYSQGFYWPVIPSRRALAASPTSTADTTKSELLDLLALAPRNAPTPTRLTVEILQAVERLEEHCPCDDSELLPKLAGTWELLWTTQDRTRQESRFRWINPLENQSYSNNPDGHANPFLPLLIQDRLEAAGIVSKEPVSRSTQSIDIQSGQVRNVVVFGVGRQSRIALTVNIGFEPDASDARRINVKFEECRVQTPLGTLDVPLGLLGPRGWLRTGYVDDNLRITRGHKGSVFILQRPRQRREV